MTVKWSAFSAGSAIASANEFVGLQSSVNVRWTFTQLGAYLATNTLAAGTLTDSAPMTLTQTWNDAADTFIGFSVDITSTASAAASSPFRVRVGGSSIFAVRKDSVIFSGALDAALFAFNNDAAQLAWYIGSFGWTDGNDRAAFYSSGSASFSVGIGLHAGGVGLQSPDVRLYRDAANTLAQRNGTNAQALRVYNTFTAVDNYARLVISTGNILVEAEGAGSSSDLYIGSRIATTLHFLQSNTDRWVINTSGYFLAGADNVYDIGATGATRPRTGYFGTSVVAPLLSVATSTTYTAVTAGPILKQGANGRVGTFIADGTNAVTVSNSSIAITDAIIISLNTVGGTIVTQPVVKTITASTSFTVTAGATDTSTYNYAIIKNAA